MAKRYKFVSDFDFIDRTYVNDSPEEQERKDLLRKATYVVVIDGKVQAGGKCYGLDSSGHTYIDLRDVLKKDEMIFRFYNPNGEVDNLLGFREGHPLRNLNYDPCEKYREEYIKKYGGKIEDLRK